MFPPDALRALPLREPVPMGGVPHTPGPSLVS
jgi:hypothetical protein